MQLEYFVEKLESDFSFKANYETGSNQKKSVKLLINNEFPFHLSEGNSDDELILSSPFLQLEKEMKNKSDIYYLILNANLYLKRTEGAIFAIDQKNNFLVLFKKINPIKIDYKAFSDFLSQFIAFIQKMRQDIELKKQIFESPAKSTPITNISNYIKV